MSTIKTREIKFRQKTKDSWHFWGYIGNDFISPMNGIKESMQYTGLKDKNGREIFEGDAIRVGEIPDKQNIIIEDIRCLDDISPWVKERVWLEVIGNVYENPELIANKPV